MNYIRGSVAKDPRRLSDSNLIVRSYRKEDKDAVQKICRTHFRSLCSSAVRYYLVENSSEIIALLCICKIFLTWRELFIVIFVYIIYLFIRAHWEIEQYIYRECYDLDQIETFYMSKPRSHFWVAEYKISAPKESKDDGNEDGNDDGNEDGNEDGETACRSRDLRGKSIDDTGDTTDLSKNLEPSSNIKTSSLGQLSQVSSDPLQVEQTYLPNEFFNSRTTAAVENLSKVDDNLLQEKTAEQKNLSSGGDRQTTETANAEFSNSEPHGNLKDGPKVQLENSTKYSEDENVQYKIVGCVGCGPTRDDPKISQLVRLVVSEEARRMRIGTRLLVQFEQFADKNGYEEVRLYTSDLNTDHFKFIRQHRYEIFQQIPRSLMRGSLIHWRKKLNSVTPNKRIQEEIDDIAGCNTFQ